VEELASDTGGPLLTGEAPDTVHPDDVEHWIAVYSELLAGTGHLRSSPASDRRIDEEHERLRQRLAFWLRRRDELRPA
jgi:hypothetical protein